MNNNGEAGTSRDFGNMMNEYLANKTIKKKRKKEKFSPWTKMKGKSNDGNGK